MQINMKAAIACLCVTVALVVLLVSGVFAGLIPERPLPEGYEDELAISSEMFQLLLESDAVEEVQYGNGWTIATHRSGESLHVRLDDPSPMFLKTGTSLRDVNMVLTDIPMQHTLFNAKTIFLGLLYMLFVSVLVLTYVLVGFPRYPRLQDVGRNL